MKGEEIMSINGVSFGQQPPAAAKGMDPEAYAQQYANEKGISIDQAREELRAQHGDPMQGSGGAGSNSTADALSTGNVDGTGKQSSIPPEAWQLQSLGIPLEVIQQGDDAIHKFAEENNIQLPEKTQGNSINFES